MILNKAWLFIIWILTLLGLIGIMFWVQHFAYNGDHIAYDPYWVQPLQWGFFIVILGVGIVCVALLIFPDDWFIRDADREIERIKKM